MASAPITITKIDAARRQTDSAITMWFFDGDPVSICTLGAAALEILHDLGKRVQNPAIRYNPRYFKDEYFKEWWIAVRKSQNFFKHADQTNDPIAVHEFRPESNQFLLLDCVHTYNKITDEITPVMKAFSSYFIVLHPDCLEDGSAEDASHDLRSLPKAQFFQEYLPLIHAAGHGG